MFGGLIGGGKNTIGVDEYEKDAAMFMLGSMFNQFSKDIIENIYLQSGQKFAEALDLLLELQTNTGKKPKTVYKPKLPERFAKNIAQGLPPIKPQTIKYRALDDNFDFYSVVKWKTFDMQNENHLRLLKGEIDPIECENLLERGLAGEDDVIQMPCATKRLKCNFLRSTIIKSLRMNPTCPSCNTRYPIPGTQPTGTLDIKVSEEQDCESFRGDGTIVLTFSFPAGVQGENHKTPGARYAGTVRVAYLPNVDDGKRTCQLLIEAFKQGQIFTIGPSLTNPGGPEGVTFGSVHLKTQRSGGTGVHGWPDNTYFSRVKSECGAKMIFLEDVNADMQKMKKQAGESAEIL